MGKVGKMNFQIISNSSYIDDFLSKEGLGLIVLLGFAYLVVSMSRRMYRDWIKKKHSDTNKTD